MDKQIQEKAKTLIHETRVMTLAVSFHDLPWSSPVYFVFYDKGFYFFSNEASKHIQYADNKKPVSASIFQDSDQMDMIFGFQMHGVVEKVSGMGLHMKVVKRYASKFDFLQKIFGNELVENRTFFLDKFKSHLYCFYPEKIMLSDNARTTGKRTPIDLDAFL